MDEFAVGVVGAGWMATDYHIPAYRDHPSSRVVAVADVTPARREETAERFGIAGYEDVHAMLDGESLDVVSICTPPSTHENIFVAAARAGCHVFCEKPLAVDAEAARAMRSVAEQEGIVTQVGYLHRYYENSKKAMRMVRNDLLGSIVEVRTQHHSTPPEQGWYYDPDVSGGGVLRDLLPHTLDIYVDLFGEGTVERCSTRELRGRGVEDAGEVGLRFDVGSSTDVPVDVSVSWSQPEGFWQTSVVGTDGWLAFDPETLEGDVHGRSFEFRRGESPVVDIGLASLYGASEDDAHVERIRDFVDHVAAGDRATAAPVERGVAVAEAIDTCYELAGERS
jgi:predicted dehydrogenase